MIFILLLYSWIQVTCIHFYILIVGSQDSPCVNCSAAFLQSPIKDTCNHQNGYVQSLRTTHSNLFLAFNYLDCQANESWVLYRSYIMTKVMSIYDSEVKSVLIEWKSHICVPNRHLTFLSLIKVFPQKTCVFVRECDIVVIHNNLIYMKEHWNQYNRQFQFIQ